MHQCDIGTRVFTNDFGIELTTIAQLNFDRGRIIHHVVVCHDIAFSCVNDDTGTQGHKFLLLSAIPPGATLTARSTTALTERRTLEGGTVLAERGVITEELLEIPRHTRRINRGAAFYVNTYNGWHDLFQHGRQAWHLLRSRHR